MHFGQTTASENRTAKSIHRSAKPAARSQLGVTHTGEQRSTPVFSPLSDLNAPHAHRVTRFRNGKIVGCSLRVETRPNYGTAITAQQKGSVKIDTSPEVVPTF